MAFDSPEAQQLNKEIFETIYYHSLKASSEIAAREGPYETYEGSPISKGILQPDMWNVVPSSRWNWDVLREMISANGVRNSLLILGNNECFEPYTSNIYSRRVLSGEFVVVNKHLLHDLTNYLNQTNFKTKTFHYPLHRVKLKCWFKKSRSDAIPIASCASQRRILLQQTSDNSKGQIIQDLMLKDYPTYKSI
ncbi:hypothetical protein K2173_002633 [Erythroxylum novogranatense]|uniref:Ribonucleotide reductase large subunit C-terminal domain-containing protein n=1 Tax=Erythroxylum novogranatense TaxID=1862640 RepID=A0AAV8SXK4_9ROSI|nr:hypothetical protein K2173_002633 [Erythroxylum novogranatense]